MRRSALRRGKPLEGRAQPLRRSEGALRPSGLLRGSGRSDGLKRSRTPGPPEGPLTPGEWRYRVWVADHGRCVECGEEVPLLADHWTWQAHHVAPKERLRREGLYHLVWDPANGVTLCTPCHGRIEGGEPPRALPLRFRGFLERLGQRAAGVVDRGTLT